jgi:hypothetical protein
MKGTKDFGMHTENQTMHFTVFTILMVAIAPGSFVSFKCSSQRTNVVCNKLEQIQIAVSRLACLLDHHHTHTPCLQAICDR